MEIDKDKDKDKNKGIRKTWNGEGGEGVCIIITTGTMEQNVECFCPSNYLTNYNRSKILCYGICWEKLRNWGISAPSFLRKSKGNQRSISHKRGKTGVSAAKMWKMDQKGLTLTIKKSIKWWFWTQKRGAFLVKKKLGGTLDTPSSPFHGKIPWHDIRRPPY